MNTSVDHRLLKAKAYDWDRLVEDLHLPGLKRAGPHRTGPCPSCGGNDRFNINTRLGVFGCRRCDAKGDQVGLVMLVKGIGFAPALEWLAGPSQTLTPAEIAKIDKDHAANEARKAKQEQAFHDRAVAEARAIWTACQPAENSPVRDYLALRGISRAALPVLPRTLRYHPDLPYMVESQDRPGTWLQAHRGPAMVAVIQSPEGGNGRGVHRTWFDLTAPQGKVVITHPDTGAVQKRKKTWGSKKGGVIQLHCGSAADLVMGEGIETTFSALASGRFPEAHFWAGIDLGNMAGQRQLGKGLKYAGIPDLKDKAAFVPPEWVKRLIYVQDGDSDPRDTRAKLEAGLRRAMALRPGLVGQIVVCPPGEDLNDVLMRSQLPSEAPHV